MGDFFEHFLYARPYTKHIISFKPHDKSISTIISILHINEA